MGFKLGTYDVVL